MFYNVAGNVFNNHPKSSHYKIFDILSSAAADFHKATSGMYILYEY